MVKIESVPLSEVCEIERHSVAPQAIGDEPYVSLEDIDPISGTIRSSTRDQSKSTKFRFEQHHVLYGKLRPYLQKVARPEAGGLCSTDILPIRPGKRLNRDYLFHFLRSPEFTARATRSAVGVNLPRLSPSVLSTFTIPLPPLSEQRRIAAILDKADELRAKRRAAIKKLDELTQSIFLDMFGDPATNPKGWPICCIEEVATIVSGATPRTDVAEYWDGDINWVTPKELSGLESIYLYTTERRITDAGLQSCAASVLPAGSVLFSSRAPIGHTAICATPMATNQGFKSFVPKEGVLDPHYLLFWLRLRKSYLEGLGTGATFKEVSKAVVARITLGIPPMDMQKAFADIVRNLERTKQVHQTARAESDALFASLQHRAFRGEL